MRRRTGTAVGALLVTLGASAAVAPQAAAAAYTNAVVTWDRNAQTAIWDVGQQLPWVQGRSFAMVSGAVYDAVNAIAGAPYEPYLLAPRASGRESVDAAVATAAYRVLASLLPEQADRLRAQYDEALAAVPDGPAEQGGVAVGDRTAAAMIAARVDDGSFGSQRWVHGTQPGQWRPAPPGFASEAAWVGFVKPFLGSDPASFRTGGPPRLTSAAYARDLNEIKSVGAAQSTTRTADQTEAAIWWHDRNVTEWQMKRQIAETQRLSALRTARMFAMVDVTLADTQIACFVDKRHWSFWRPITGVQLAGTDGNPRTTADPAWTSLLVSPPFPDHPSGHTCATASRMATMRTFFGRDRVPFSAYSVAAGTTRSFDSFSEAVDEVVHARVWGGIHFRTASEQGRELGEAVSAWSTARHFRPRR